MVDFTHEKEKKNISISFGTIFAIIIIAIVAIQLLKYYEEGEKKLPFKIDNILIISTADGIGKKDTINRWNFSVLQNNDIYIQINDIEDKRKEDFLKRIILQEFTIIKSPKIGEPAFYHPVNDKDVIYIYNDENKVNEKIEYNTAKENNVKKRKITKEGGIISFSSCINNISSYESNMDTEIVYDGTLLNKVYVKENELRYQISFDIIVEMESGKKYKATYYLNLPNEDISKEGVVQNTITNFDDVVFKRI